MTNGIQENHVQDNHEEQEDPDEDGPKSLPYTNAVNTNNISNGMINGLRFLFC